MFPDLIWPDFQPMRSDGRLEEILGTLDESGIYIKEDFIDPKYVSIWKNYAEIQAKGKLFHESAIGKKSLQTKNASIRSDKIFWVHSFSESLKPIGDWLTCLSAELKNHFRISLDDIEAHFSIYSKGNHYDKHIDNSAGLTPRLFTFIFYLNPEWKPGDGGELVVYNPINQDDRIFTIAPKAGTFVLFRSDLFYHEVLPSQSDRYTFTGWLRRHARV
jgi:SM-20-related protein